MLVWGWGPYERSMRRVMSHTHSICHSDIERQSLAGFNSHYDRGINVWIPVSTVSCRGHKKSAFLMLRWNIFLFLWFFMVNMNQCVFLVFHCVFLNQVNHSVREKQCLTSFGVTEKWSSQVWFVFSCISAAHTNMTHINSRTDEHITRWRDSMCDMAVKGFPTNKHKSLLLAVLHCRPTEWVGIKTKPSQAAKFIMWRINSTESLICYSSSENQRNFRGEPK